MDDILEKRRKKQLVVILLGPPGSGKGTQAGRLSRVMSIPHISTGDLFRENIRQGTDLGNKAKHFLDNGLLGPDELVIDMLFNRVAKPDCKDGFLLDGYPRTLLQVEELERRLADVQEIVVHLKVEDSIIIERASGRLLCKNCGYIQHQKFSPPKVEGVCDRCGGELYQRSDDNPEVVKKRLKIYHSQTTPLLTYYDKKGLLQEVDGERNPDQVFLDLQGLVLQPKK